MKRCIITPTYKNHFVYVKVYLESMKKYLKDKDFPIYFIIQKSERHEFKRIVNKYQNILNIKIICLEEVFEAFDIKLTPKEALDKYGRLSFQTLKKMYSALYIGSEQFLFLDSESILVAETDMNELFQKYFSKPVFLVSKISTRPEEYKDEFTFNYVQTINQTLGVKNENWSIESYTWFYELHILKDLIFQYGSIIDLVDEAKLEQKFVDLEGILEALLYYQFLTENCEKYGYQMRFVEAEFEDKLGSKAFVKFITEFNFSDIWLGGYMEMFPRFVTSQNYKAFVNILRENNCQIIRMDNNFKNKKWTKKMVKMADVKILASSQENTFTRQFIPISIRIRERTRETLKKLNPLYRICSYIYYDSWNRHHQVLGEIGNLKKTLEKNEQLLKEIVEDKEG